MAGKDSGRYRYEVYPALNKKQNNGTSSFKHNETSFKSLSSSLKGRHKCCTCLGATTTPIWAGILANIGICALLFAYSLLGSFMFLAIEGGASTIHQRTLASTNRQSSRPIQKLDNVTFSPAAIIDALEARQRTVENIWEITVSLNILYRENWTRLAAIEIARFQDQLIKRLAEDVSAQLDANLPSTGAVMLVAHSNNYPEYEWTFARAFLYSLTVLTTIVNWEGKAREMKETVLLAYSGGLDTSCILKWLIEENYNVVCFMADVGQGEDFDAAKMKAINIGASDVIYKDLKKDFVENYVWPSVQMGLIYEERYLLGTSLARPCIVVSLIETARQCGAKYISHGATGKGNDQVRFELNAYALCPNIKIIAPWRCKKFCEQFQGRQALLEYARIHSIPISATPKAPWSIDGNILHTSYESGMMEDPTTIPPENIFHMTKSPFKAPLNPYRVLIHFAKGFPKKVEDVLTKKNYNTPLEIMNFLNEVGGSYGVGRIDIVENRFVGLKSRGVYETPGGTILYEAHRDLEIYCLDRECFRLKSYLRDRMSDYVYNGLWFSPEALFAADCLKTSQKNVSGVVRMEIGPGYTRPIARSSNEALYNQELVSMDVHGEYNSSDASGFISISSIRIKEYYRAYGSYLSKK